VAIDPTGRLDAHGKWLAEDGARRILISAAPVDVPRGVELVRLPARDGQIAPTAIVDALFARGLCRILVEGGARTVAGFIQNGCIDRLHVLIAPVIIGLGRTGLDLPPAPELALALRPRAQAHVLGGGDVLFDCDFADYRRQSN
jgi:riboflavin biosynthesis pyrimidine reductase